MLEINSLKLKSMNKFPFIFTLIILFDFIIFTNQNYNISSLNNFSTKTINFNISEKYIFYLDIQDYKIGDENVLQILCQYSSVLSNLSILEIDESIINKENEIINDEDIIILRNITEKNIKRKLYRSQYYYDIIIQKKKKNQNFFIILLEGNIERDFDIQIELYVSSIIPNYYIYPDDIDNNKIFTDVFYIDQRIEKFFKFNLINVSLEQSNLIFYVNEKQVSSFIIGNISSNNIFGRLFIIEKNTTNELNHTIYLSLIGEVKSTNLKISKDYHDLKYYYNSKREDTSLYIERLNCNKDFYIIENYDTSEKTTTNHYLNQIPFYGDYKLVFYEDINGSNIEDIFKPSNEIEIDKKVKKINSYFNILKLSCKTATLLKLKYFINNKISKIIEGEEIIIYREKNSENILIGTDDFLKKYIFFFGIYENGEGNNTTEVSLNFKTRPYLDNKFKDRSNTTFQIFHQKESIYNTNKFSFRLLINGYLKIFLISNLYYKNIVEGLTEITSETKSISFKVRKDIIFDYFIINIYSNNREKLISCDYELKIVESNNIIEGYPYVSINPIKILNKKEIIFKFSNPYDKFNSRIGENDYIYFLSSFKISNEDIFPLYIDIRYYYNKESTLPIEQFFPKILLNEKEYKIYGYQNYTDKNKLLINLNKCNSEKNYNLKSYYENSENIIAEEEVSRKRNILLHDNLFNNTKILLYLNESENITNKNNSEPLKASYYEDGDIYMNYFPINETLYNFIEINEDFNILYKDNKKQIKLYWSNYIRKQEIISDLNVNYSLYILPSNSPINSICQLYLIPPNISMINKHDYEITLSKGQYKIAILASIINTEFPLTTYYDILNLDVPTRINIKLIIIIIISISAVIAIIAACLFCNKKEKNNEEASKSKIISMANIFGYYDEQEEELLQNEKEENIIKFEEQNHDDNNNNDNDNDSAIDNNIEEI